MSIVVKADTMANIVCASLGIDPKNVVNLRLECVPGDITRVHVEFLVSTDNLAKICKASGDYLCKLEDA